jgi:hypothetical protein
VASPVIDAKSATDFCQKSCLSHRADALNFSFYVRAGHDYDLNVIASC